LELYFKQKLQESFEYREIGSWWDSKKSKISEDSEESQNEIDIVAIKLDNKNAFVAEVKRQKKNFKPQLFESKVKVLKNKVLDKYHIDSKCLDLNDM
jgi:hypothetical protein